MALRLAAAAIRIAVGCCHRAATKKLEAMARRAWCDGGIIILWPDRTKDERDRQRVLSIT
jgi:hypothetical protein